MTLPESLQPHGDRAVLEALVCFEKIGTHDFAGRDAELAEQLIQCALVRATVSSRFLLTDGEVRLRVQSHGLTVAGGWMKRVLGDDASRSGQSA